MTCASACVLFIAASNIAVIGSGPASVTLLQSGDGYTAIYDNRIVKSFTTERFEVSLDGVTVTGAIIAEDGWGPDRLVVYPPTGYWCDPCQIVVNEDESGAVELYPEMGA
jgi:hypothetical protein